MQESFLQSLSLTPLTQLWPNFASQLLTLQNWSQRIFNCAWNDENQNSKCHRNFFPRILQLPNRTSASKINVTPKGVRLSEKQQHSVMKFDRDNKFDLCYYREVNSLRLRLSVASKWANKHLWGYHLFCWRWYNDDFHRKTRKFFRLCYTSSYFVTHKPFVAWILFSVDLWNISQDRLVSFTDS